MEAAQQELEEEFRTLTRIIGVISEPAFANYDEYELRERIELLETAFTNYKLNYKIVLNGTAESDGKLGVIAQYEEAEDRYATRRAKMKKRISELAPPANANQPPPAAEQQIIQVQVPPQPVHVTRTWPDFFGDPLAWCEFKTQFKLGAHDVAGVSNQTKMGLLRDALKGYAAAAMDGYGMDPARYEDFWNELNQKYEQRYVLACAYLKRFFALKQLDRMARAAEVRALCNETKSLIRKIKELNYEVQHWDLLIVFTLQERLNRALARRWEEKRQNNELPTIDEMTKFLEDEATMMANYDMQRSPLTVSVKNEYANRSAAPSSAGAFGASSTKVYGCAVCDSKEHLPPGCKEYAPLIYRDRLETARQNNMCHICLKRGHHKKNCFDLRRCDEPECRRKDDRHHESLCAVKTRSEHVNTVHLSDARSTDSHGHRRDNNRHHDNRQQEHRSS